MNLVIINECNRRCPYCFETSFREPPRELMSLSDVERLCRFFSLDTRPPGFKVRLLGGEPTLHPEILDIIDLISEFNAYAPVLLLTNLTCDPELTNELLKRNVRWAANIAEPEHNTPEQQVAIDENISLLSEAGAEFSVPVTITRPDQSFEYLYALLRKEAGRSIWAIRIGLPAVGYGFNNQFVSEFSQAFGEKYRSLVENCHTIEPRLTIGNECPVNLCLMEQETFRLLSYRVNDLQTGCSRINMDIMPDLSTQKCFAFRGVPELRIENVFEYPDPETLYAVLKQKMCRLASSVRPQCDHQNCSSLICQGPCLAYNYYRQEVLKRQEGGSHT